MKLQKILYLTASEYAKTTGNTLFWEDFQAWKYGPVLPSIYQHFQPFGSKPITTYAIQDAMRTRRKVNENSDIHLKEALDKVWNRTQHKTGIELAHLTRLENSAWRNAWNKGELTITPEAILNDTSYQKDLRLEYYGQPTPLT